MPSSPLYESHPNFFQRNPETGWIIAILLMTFLGFVIGGGLG